MKNWGKFVLLGSFIVGGMVGCAKEKTDCLPTPVASENVSIATAVTPSESSDELIAITEENFGDVRFCNYLKETYDESGDGFFSEKERVAVTEIDLHPNRIMIEPYTSLKGFSYFPELEEMVLNSVKSIEVCGVPKLESVVWHGNSSAMTFKLGEVMIKDCPLLKEIVFGGTSFIGDSETENSRIEVENCPAVERMSLSGENIERLSMKVLDTPRLRLSVRTETNGNWPHDMVLDSRIVLEEGPLPLLNIAEKKIQAEEMHIIWEGESLSIEEPLQELEEVIRKVKSGFFVEIQEVIPELRDADGRKAYSIRVESAQLASGNYGVYVSKLDSFEELREKYDYYGKGLVMYLEQEPTKEQFSFVWKEENLFRLSEYSPQSGISGGVSQGVEGTLLYTNEKGTEEIGIISPYILYTITEKGLEASADEVWEPENGRYDKKAMVTESGGIAEGDVLICKENFSNILFRDYLREEIDLDHNGVLSRAEREVITLLDLRDFSMGVDIVDGFCHFPNLKSLYLSTCRMLSCVDCPELMEVAIFPIIEEETNVEVEVENCPKLKEVIQDAYWSCEGDEILSLKDLYD